MKAALEAEGYEVGDAADFFELTEEERQIVDLRIKLGRAIRDARTARGFTQVEAAKVAQTSQSRYSKIELGLNGVTLDLMIRTLIRLDGHFSYEVKQKAPKTTKGKASPAKVKAAKRLISSG